MRHALCLAWAIALIGCPAASAQSLEESVLTLERSGAASKIRREGPGLIVAEDINLEVRVVDAVACTVRLTDRSRPEFTTITGEWDSAPAKPSPNLGATHREIYFGRVIPADIKKIPQVLGTRNGVVVEKLDDAQWRLPGSPGDEIWCSFSPDKTKTCWDEKEYSRISIVRGLPDQRERTGRVDRALVSIYADFCKGAQKRVPF